MGTQINLTLNDVDIDVGKNQYWDVHAWLFPPGSIKDIEYRYASNHKEIHPGFETTLDQATFRMNHLGYSVRETEFKFNAAVARWNRTGSLLLSFDRFRDALTSVEFGVLVNEDLIPFHWHFRTYVVHLLEQQNGEDWQFEDFVLGLDFAILLRAIATRADNLPLPLRWHHYDLMESGWASLEDLTDIDRGRAIADHHVLFARLQDVAPAGELGKFDNWLAHHGLHKATMYIHEQRDGRMRTDMLTLPVAVRNLLSHPENKHNQPATDEQVRESLESMLRVAALPDVAAALAVV